jgi:hypothetical protein
MSSFGKNKTALTILIHLLLSMNLKQLLFIVTFCIAFITFSYSQPFTIQTGFFPYALVGDIKWGDYDNDGDLDYVIYYNTGSPNYLKYIKVFDNVGNGSFSEQVSITSFYAGNSLSWCDYDKDGDLDIFHFFGGGTLSEIEVYKNNGNRSFSLISGHKLKKAYDGNNAIGDFNNDGYPDLIYNGHLSTSETFLYLNNGNATFKEVTNHSIIGLCYGSFDLRDFDGNGYLDILMSGEEYPSGKSYTKIYKNNGNGTFSEIAYTFVGVENSNGLRGTPSRWGDYDNDGDFDVVQAGNNNIYLYTNMGNGNYKESFDTISIPGFVNGSVSLGDYNNDGYLDILASGMKSSVYISKVFNNDGSGKFTEATNISLSNQAGGITQWVDYDSDGDLDIVLRGLLYRNDRIISSLRSSSLAKNIKLYPNPANDMFYIQGVQANYEIIISDITGKVYNKLKSNGGQNTISITSLSKGIYFIQVNSGNYKWTDKFIKN